jgi:hypothetical protein
VISAPLSVPTTPQTKLQVLPSGNRAGRGVTSSRRFFSWFGSLGSHFWVHLGFGAFFLAHLSLCVA